MPPELTGTTALLVPDPLIGCVIGDTRVDYVSAANEGDAVAIAAGAWIGGHRGVAMMQNSGLGNALNPLSHSAQCVDY